MKLLFKLAFQNRKNRILVALTLIAMCFSTFANQMEVLTLGIITRKGPGFFELFAPFENGRPQATSVLSKQEIEARWSQIAGSPDAPITAESASRYLAEVKNNDFLDRLIQNINYYLPISGNLKYLAIFLVFVALFKAITLFIHRFTTRLVAIRVSRDLRQKYFEHIQSLPMSFFQQHTSGSLSSRVVADAALIAEAVNSCLINYLQTPFNLATTLTLCFLTSWQLSLIIFFGFPLVLVPIVFLAHRVKRISKQIQQNQDRFASVLLDFIAGIQTVKVFAMEDFSLKKYREHNRRMASLEQKSARYDLSSRPIVHTIGMFFLATALVYGLYVIQMSVSEVLVYCGLLYVLYEPIKKFAEENSHIQRGVAAAERMFEVLQLKPQIEDHPQADKLVDFKGPIEFDNVSFRYQDQWILKDVSFTVRKGETVAIVGPTGAGKSTIVQLLPRLYEVQQGEIRINGKPIQTYTQKSLREQIAFVPQKPFLFLDTVAENISFGRNFTLEEIQEAAKKAHADEFITCLPQGYVTELCEAGKNLSGGQQQRLAIARALVKNAPILVMDEATSSLDAISENHIKMAIHQLRGQITQIIIAHRLSTIEDADRIIYLEKGRKVAEGDKAELLRSCEGFRNMWEMMHNKSNRFRDQADLSN